VPSPPHQIWPISSSLGGTFSIHASQSSLDFTPRYMQAILRRARGPKRGSKPSRGTASLEIPYPNFSQVRSLYPAQKARHGRPTRSESIALLGPATRDWGGGYLQECCFTVSACESPI